MTPAPPPVQRRRRWLALVAALLVVVTTALAGRWQLSRADQKALLQATLEARLREPALELTGLVARGAALDVEALRFRAASAQGHYLAQAQIYIDNRDQDGVPGYHVLTPLALGAQVLLVNRGFLARDASYPRTPQVSVPAGTLTVSGLLVPARSRFLELSQDTVSGPVWQNLKLDQYAAHTGLSVLPLVLLADPAGAGLLAVHEQPDANIAMHRGYAFQWFALCATTILITLYFTLVRRPPRAP